MTISLGELRLHIIITKLPQTYIFVWAGRLCFRQNNRVCIPAEFVSVPTRVLNFPAIWPAFSGYCESTDWPPVVLKIPDRPPNKQNTKFISRDRRLLTRRRAAVATLRQ